MTLPLQEPYSDNKLRKQIVQFWHELDIPGARKQIKTVDVGIRTGELHSWNQLKDLLEPYDSHAPLAEGEEIGRERIGNDDDDDDNSDDEVDDDNADDDDAYAHEDEHLHECEVHANAEDDVEGLDASPDVLGASSANTHGRPSCAESSSKASLGTSQIFEQAAMSRATDSGSSHSKSADVVVAASASALLTPCTDAPEESSSDSLKDPSNEIVKLLKMKQLKMNLGLQDKTVLKTIETRTRDLHKLRFTTHPAVSQVLREHGKTSREDVMSELRK